MTDSHVYGIHAVVALLKSRLRKPLRLYVSKERQDKRIESILEEANKRKIPLDYLSKGDLNLRFPDQTHQGIVAQATSLEEYREQNLKILLEKAKKPALVLILDGVTDPHNLGAVLRTADATAVDFVIIPKDKNVGITPIVAKVASGALETIPLVRVTNLVRSLDILKEAGVWVYGAAGEARQSIYDLDGKISIAIVMGAEGEGLRRLTREHCDGLFSLPMKGSVESLNVSVATAVSLYEILRQRG